MSEKLPKSERIRSERRIDALFKGGRRGGVGPVKYCWAATAVGTPTADNCGENKVVCSCEAGVAVMFSVPKKVFRRAWKRNLIKRRLRESYRRRKDVLVEKAVAAGLHIDIAFICAPIAEKGVPAEIPDFKTIDNAVAKILEQILARS